MIRIIITGLLLVTLLSSCASLLQQKPQEAKTEDIRILISDKNGRDSLQFAGKYTLHSEEARYEFGDKNQRIFIEPVESGYRIFNENRIFKFNENDKTLFTPADNDGRFKHGGKTYAGALIVAHKEPDKILLINNTDMEWYLKGVVPAEIPSRNGEYMDAVKAQAICARTYAMNRKAARKTQLFHVYGDVRDQVYGGVSNHSKIANMAVDQTRGDVLMYGDTLATVFYHSTCGGLLESGEAIFSAAKQPYLQAGKDALGDHFTCEASPLFRWERRYTPLQLDTMVANYYGRSPLKLPVGDTTTIRFKAKVLKRTSQGRVINMEIGYRDTSFTLSNYAIRRFFKLPGKRDLPSTLFTVSNQGDSLLIIKGGGFGHGVGMCQWGALQMAKQGFKYYDILVNKYFRGTYLKKVY